MKQVEKASPNLTKYRRQAKRALVDLPTKTKPLNTNTLQYTILELKETINAARAKGYTYADIVELLKDYQIYIAPGTLRRYMSLANQSAEEASEPEVALAEPSPLRTELSPSLETETADNTKRQRFLSSTSRSSNAKQHFNL